jgi:NAD(P)-dependent dehydrogenase (short-subunit alcohol dehydrogenase family)
MDTCDSDQREGRPGSPPAPSYAGRRVLVTGGGRGIGRAIALAMGARGAAVAVAGRTPGPLRETARDLGELGAASAVIQADLTDDAQAGQLVGETVAAIGGIDILVNNAGGWGDTPGAVGPILEATPEGFDFVFRLNVRSPLFLTIAAAKAMIGQGTGGCVLNIASVDGLAPAPTEALYGAAKSAVLSFTGTLAYELGPHGIRVNSIAPGVIETEMTAPWLATPEQRADRASFYPISRIGTPADVAAAAVFLCSPEASWISGVTLPVCGGQFGTSDIFRWVRSHNTVPDEARILCGCSSCGCSS